MRIKVKRFISAILSLLVIISVMPTTIVQAASDNLSSLGYSDRIVYLSIERYDAEKGLSVLEPVKAKINVSGKSMLNVVDEITKKYSDKIKEKGKSSEQNIGGGVYLINQVLGISNNENNIWFTALNNDTSTDAGSAWGTSIKSKGDGDLKKMPVIRLIYGDKTGEKLGITTPLPKSDSPVKVSKDELIKQVVEASEKYPAGNVIIDNAKECLINTDATEDDVKKQIENLTNLINGTLQQAEKVLINNKENLSVKIGHSIKLSTTFEPSGAVGNVEWTVDNTKIATVDKLTGELTGVSEGDVVVTATLEGKTVTDTAEVHVERIPTSTIKINEEYITVEEGSTTKLTTTVTPLDTTDKVIWTSKNTEFATVEADGTIKGIKAGKAVIEAKSGDKTATVEVTVKKNENPYIYFEHKDGRRTILDTKTNSIDLSIIDEGKFKVSNFDGNIDWFSERSVTDHNGSLGTEYIVKSDGTYDPYKVSTDDVVITFNPFTEDEYIHMFTLNTKPSELEDIRVKVNGEIYSNEKAFSVTGASTALLSVEGKKKGSNEYVHIPNTAVTYTTSTPLNAIVNINGELKLIKDSSIITAMIEEGNFDIRTDFKAVVGDVHVEGMNVSVPEEAIIDKWNFLGGYYVGVQPHTGYKITFTPSNVTNKETEWEPLNDVATHMHAFDNGIIPNKNGVAEFKVSSVDNPEISQIVKVKFRYKTPLESVELNKRKYVINEGSTELIKPSYTPSNPTEERFNWTFESKDGGKIKIDSSVLGDGDYKYFKHEITAINKGTVKVTGTPIDTTNNCAPITFEVKVKGVSDVDSKVNNVKEDIEFGMNSLYKPGIIKYGEEWGIFSLARAGHKFSDKEKATYVESLEKVIALNKRLEPTDNARVILALTSMGLDPRTIVKNKNFVESIYNAKGLSTDHKMYTSNMLIWALDALDSYNYEVPADAENTRDSLIKGLLDYQMSNGGFNLNFGKDASLNDPMLDITAMAIQSLANYKDRPEVKQAIDKALEYINERLTGNAGFINEGGENSCTQAQVIVALSKLEINFLSPSEGFIRNNKNIITRLQEFKANGGFVLINDGRKADGLSTAQATYALEAYRRFESGEKALFDLTDVKLSDEKPIAPEMKPEVNEGTGDVVIKDTTSTSIEFSPSSIEKVENNLVIELADAKVIYDKEAVEAIKKQLPMDTTNIKVEIKLTNRYEEKTLTDTQISVIKKNRHGKLYKVTLQAIRENGEIVNIKNLGNGTSKITVNYVNSENKELDVVRVEEDGTLTLVKSSYLNGELTWLTGSHSFYMVAEKGSLKGEITEEKPVDKNDGLSGNDNNVNNNDIYDDNITNNVGNKAPHTGDEANIFVWMLLLISSIIVIPVVCRRNNI